MDRNNTSYQINLSERIKKVYERYKKIENPFLLFHQYLLRELYTDPSYGINGKSDGTRGMLINHGVGTGKTILAVSVLLALMDIRPAILLIPKSLQSNFSNTIDKLVDDVNLAEKIKQQLNFVSIDAFNSSYQLKSKSGSLDGKLLIVDESHNFFKSIINSTEGETNAKTMYNMIMSAVDLRIIFLTGTPITKDPFEIVCAINMLTGRETLPSSYEIFESNFIDNGRHIKNKNILQNRLFGLISYIRTNMSMYPDDSNFNKENNLNDYPKDLGITVEKVEMSKDQFIKYATIRDKEEKFSLKKKTKTGASNKIPDIPNMSLPTSKKKGSYFIESRMVSNFAIPSELVNKDINIDKLDIELFNKNNSSKIFRLIHNIKNGNRPALIYSQFLKGGLEIVAKYLDKDKFDLWKVEEFSNKVDYKPRYAIISGNIKPSDRDLIVKKFNSIENMYGDIIAVLLISETGAEGLDLKYIREVHILEPYWDMSRIKQIQGRAIRKNSHADLSEAERNVKTTIYVSVHNKELKDSINIKENDSIDMQFLTRAQRKMKLIEEFDVAMKEVSIECIVNNYENCRLCLPNNSILFNPNNLLEDLDSKFDSCKPYSIEEKVKVTEVDYNGDKYFYKRSNDNPYGIIIYFYDKELEGYSELPLSNPNYIEIIKIIEK